MTMDCKSLMIGDIIRYDDEIIRVKDIYHYGGKGYCINEDNNDIRFAEPIPLTEEILLANGWKTDGHIWDRKDEPFFEIEGEYYHKKEGDPLFLYIANNTAELKYVHELQRALRCCGLVELANNIKV